MFENQSRSLYQRLLGLKYDILPNSIKKLHALDKKKIYHGTCCVKRGSNFLAHFLANILSLPQSGSDVAVKIIFSPDGKIEHWERFFGKKRFYSKQWEKNGKLCERLPLTTLVFDVVTSKESLELKLEQVYVLGLPIMSIFKPKVIAIETQKEGEFCFNVTLILPIIGLIIDYQGSLEEMK